MAGRDTARESRRRDGPFDLRAAPRDNVPAIYRGHRAYMDVTDAFDGNAGLRFLIGRSTRSTTP